MQEEKDGAVILHVRNVFVSASPTKQIILIKTDLTWLSLILDVIYSSKPLDYVISIWNTVIN